jgi:endonuclease VIII
VPEGDTIHRAARTLHLALADRVVTGFTSVFPHLTRLDETAPLTGRIVERVEARGKHLLIRFSGDLVLRTHMRMHGSWHIYRPGERWQRPRHEMRIAIQTAGMHAVGFNVPDAELVTTAALERDETLRQLGPDLLAEPPDIDQAVARLRARPRMEIADALLDQTALAGIGNVYKSEVLFIARINPGALVSEIQDEQLRATVTTAARLMRANVQMSTGSMTAMYAGSRNTTRRADPSARLWVYGRAGKPCRRCGTSISSRKQGPNARWTYWCERCQGIEGDRSKEGDRK